MFVLTVHEKASAVGCRIVFFGAFGVTHEHSKEATTTPANVVGL